MTAIVAGSATVVVRAAMAATSEIPIVFVIGGDPVNLGLVGSLNRPEGNVTGITNFGHAAVTKRLELLREVVPSHLVSRCTITSLSVKKAMPA